MHRRAKLTVLGRRLLVERIVGQGWPVAVAAQAQGVSAATAYKWLGRWRAEGAQGLADRSSRPIAARGGCRQPEQQAILACRLRCRVGPHRIGWSLVRHPPRCMPSCVASSCRGCGSWTAPPARWCATSASGPESCSTSISRSRAGSLMVVGIGCLAGPPATGTDARAWAMTCSTSPWMTARGWPMWRSMPMSPARPRLAYRPGAGLVRRGLGSPWSRS